MFQGKLVSASIVQAHSKPYSIRARVQPPASPHHSLPHSSAGSCRCKAERLGPKKTNVQPRQNRTQRALLLECDGVLRHAPQRPNTQTITHISTSGEDGGVSVLDRGLLPERKYDRVLSSLFFLFPRVAGNTNRRLPAQPANPLHIGLFCSWLFTFFFVVATIIRPRSELFADRRVRPRLQTAADSSTPRKPPSHNPRTDSEPSAAGRRR